MEYELRYAMEVLERAEKRLDKIQDPEILNEFIDDLKEQQQYIDRIVERIAELEREED